MTNKECHPSEPMHPRDKARLFHDLGELLRSGVTFHRALEKLGEHSRGATSVMMGKILQTIRNGATMPDALAAQPQINALDTALFAASNRAGMLERGFALASEYYTAISETRATMWRRAAYPLFVLHLACIVFQIDLIFRPGGVDEMVSAVLASWLGIWGAIICIFLFATGLARAAIKNKELDGLLAFIPLLGKMRRAFALSRFCAAYVMQIEAGVNVFSTLASAARASASARLITASENALERIRAGEKIGDALKATRAFPEPFTRSFLIGEETGQLDRELHRLADEYRVAALRRLEVISEWVPRIFYLGVLVFLSYKIISWYAGYLKAAASFL